MVKGIIKTTGDDILIARPSRNFQGYQYNDALNQSSYHNVVRLRSRCIIIVYSLININVLPGQSSIIFVMEVIIM